MLSIRHARFLSPITGALLLWVSVGQPCLAAGGAQITGGVEPAYIACLGAASFCTNTVRTQFRVQYRALTVRTLSVRIRLQRAYQLTLPDDQNDGASEEQRASRFNPPFDVIETRLRLSESNGRDHFEARAGYAYQQTDPNAVDGYHEVYLSGDYYFGRPIRSGVGSLSRDFDVLVRVARDQYATAERSAEGIAQSVATYTVPLNGTGTTRVYASYARELRLGGSNAVLTPSNRFEVGLTRDVTRWLQLYGRFSLFGTRGTQGTARGVVGADVTI